MSDPLPIIAATLAAALRVTPCTCNYGGAWPTFKVEACVSEKSKHQLRTCGRCAALEKYDVLAAMLVAKSKGDL